jgi:hypothetical protein
VNIIEESSGSPIESSNSAAYQPSSKRGLVMKLGVYFVIFIIGLSTPVSAKKSSKKSKDELVITNIEVQEPATLIILGKNFNHREQLTITLGESAISALTACCSPQT